MQNGEKIKETTSGVSQYMDANLLSVCIFESVYCVEDEGGKGKKKKAAKGIRHYLNAAPWRDPVHRAPLERPIIRGM